MNASTLHLFVVPLWINQLITCSVALLTLWRGDWRLRLVAGLQALYFIFAFSCQKPACADLPHLLWAMMAEDAFMLAVCLWCLVRARGHWIVWASAFALLQLINDLIAQALTVSEWSWVAANVIWMYGSCLAVVWGVLTAPRPAPGLSSPA